MKITLKLCTEIVRIMTLDLTWPYVIYYVHVHCEANDFFLRPPPITQTIRSNHFVEKNPLHQTLRQSPEKSC